MTALGSRHDLGSCRDAVANVIGAERSRFAPFLPVGSIDWRMGVARAMTDQCPAGIFVRSTLARSRDARFEFTYDHDVLIAVAIVNDRGFFSFVDKASGTLECVDATTEPCTVEEARSAIDAAIAAAEKI